MECVKENVVPCDVSLCINPINYLMGLVYNAAKDLNQSSPNIYGGPLSQILSSSIILSNANGKYCCYDCKTDNGFYYLGNYYGFKSIIQADGLGKSAPLHHDLTFDASRKLDCCVNFAIHDEELLDYRDDTFFKTKNKAICFGYGYLYNFLAITGPKNIVKEIDGWKIPLQSDVTELINYLGGTFEAGGKLKELGYDNDTVHWNLSNIGATNKFNFSALGSGFIDENGIYDDLRVSFSMWTKTVDPTNPTNGIALRLTNSSANTVVLGLSKLKGLSVRLVRPATSDELLLPDGTNSLDNPSLILSYVGNDGKVYGAVKIGTQVWLMENLAETKFSDNSNIPFSNNTNWITNSNLQTYTAFDNTYMSYDADSILKKEPCFDLYDKTPPCCKTNFNESFQKLRYETSSDLDNYLNNAVEVNSFNSKSGLGIMLDSLKRYFPDITKTQITSFFETIFDNEGGLVIKCDGCDIHFYNITGYIQYLTNKLI